MVYSALGITSVALPIWYYNKDSSGYHELVIEPEFLSHIMDGQSIDEIGSHYLELNPGESSETELISLLPEADATTGDGIIQKIRQEIVANYTSGDTICIDGWVLSRTEARQCALYSLNHKT